MNDDLIENGNVKEIKDVEKAVDEADDFQKRKGKCLEHYCDYTRNQIYVRIE